MHTVFVYGSLKRDFHNHCFLEGAKFLGEAVSQGKYVMWAGPNFPYVATMATGHQVTGELYRVKSLRALDALEGHPHFYRRETAVFRQGGVRFSAWIYLARLTDLREENRIAADADGVLTWGGNSEED